MTKKIQEAYIVAACRTAVGKAKGAFAHTRPDDLLAHVLKNLMDSVPEIDPSLIEDVIIGCAMPEGEQGMNVARIGALLAGLPDSVPGVTVNRFCASGLETLAQAANRINLGGADVIIAGGVESMSRIPMGGFKFTGNPKFFSNQGENIGIAYGMGITAEIVAKRYNIARLAQDEFALKSHEKALIAINQEAFKAEIVPFTVMTHYPDITTGKPIINTSKVSIDQGPRAGSSLQTLSKLKPVFSAEGSVTAGNSSQMSDGAAALLVVSESFLQQHNLTPLARFCGYSVVGVAPEIMGMGPAEAIPKVLKQTGLSLDAIDWIELNEAFAAQSLAVINEVNLDISKVNPLGGAIALGHPLGATGAIRATTVVHGLKRKRLKYGMVTMCVGTGMGAAGILESV